MQLRHESPDDFAMGHKINVVIIKQSYIKTVKKNSLRIGLSKDSIIRCFWKHKLVNPCIADMVYKGKKYFNNNYERGKETAMVLH